MRLLVIGNSNLVRKKILPAIECIPSINSVELSTNHPLIYSHHLIQHIYSSHILAIQTSTAELVYISTTNESHFKWAELSLRMGKHVIVDKPLALTYYERIQLVDLAKKNNVLLSEAVVNLYHEQFTKAKELFAIHTDYPKFISAKFVVPPFQEDNFRNFKDKGGGVLHDMGIYAITLGNYFFDSIPFTLNTQVISTLNDIDETIHITIHYPNKKLLSGIFSFNGAYTNRVDIIGEKISLTFDRVFSIPSDFSNTITLFQNLNSINFEIKSDDSFRNYFEKMIENITLQSFSKEYNKIINSSEIFKLN
jgi:predicted dehydrogenase